MIDETELIERALDYYFTVPTSDNPDQPSKSSCSLEKIGRREYVILRNSYRTLDVFRLLKRGKLKRLHVYEWPKALGDGLMEWIIANPTEARKHFKNVCREHRGAPHAAF